MSSDFDEIVSSVDMESYLDREGIQYRVTRGSRGVQLNVKTCPVCGGSDYKVYIGAETGLGNCFSGSCESKFNRWSFIKAHLGGLTNRETMEHISAVAREQGWRPKRVESVAVNMNTELHLPESFELPIGSRNLKYLENRNITNEIAKYFKLRYSQKGAYKYIDTDGKPRSQNYAGRIIIPIFDLAGDLVSFQGRDITGEAERKYLFPPGFAATGSHLYNGQNAHHSEDVVIGEGAFDVMAIKIALDQDRTMRDIVPIGSFGKHLSAGGENSQLEKLLALREDGLKRVTLMWDAEPAALDAAIETGLLLRKYGLVARIAVLPEGRDPNEVPASVVREAYWKAVVVNESVAVKMRLARKHSCVV